MKPTINNKRGSCISLTSNRRSTASITMPKHRETKNTELINGPNTSALTHPNVFFFDFLFDILNKLFKVYINVNIYTINNE